MNPSSIDTFHSVQLPWNSFSAAEVAYLRPNTPGELHIRTERRNCEQKQKTF
ncbi:hypothetical protein M408DRAFT_333637 [Serendipita vermifera MAFF 305830]|uniref:Uncharacterized protein n=1 Tax=Serendipita vermifera MAFF 305830 TaxID=933852 RepID=A0A0C3API0_SERVB|nr:hypothetical protein M408DRAFT_333637 [Serendipita vermifera MAFF 305830]